MKERGIIITFDKLESAALFYIGEAFHYINAAMETNLASVLFTEKINEIEPSEPDLVIAGKAKFPDDFIEALRQFSDIGPLTSETLTKLTGCWEQCKIESKNKSYNFEQKYICENIELLGHVNNLAFFIETLTFRHLQFLLHIKEINDFMYRQMDSAGILKILLFILKDELKLGNIAINHITNLFSLRNKAVHYTPRNSKSIKIQLDELVRLWTQVGVLIKFYEGKENAVIERFTSLVVTNRDTFVQRWLTKEK